MVERVNAGTEAPVQGEDLAVDKGGEGEIVEQVRERFPHVGIPILSETLVVEAVHLSDLSALVVPSDQVNTVRVANLQSQQQQEGLHTVEPAVHEISHEEIVCVGNIATNLKIRGIMHYETHKSYEYSFMCKLNVQDWARLADYEITLNNSLRS